MSDLMTVEVQLVGGKWGTLIEYHPGSDKQWAAACELRDTLHHLGFNALATSGPAAPDALPDEETR